ncbi:MAG: hypothetical protein A3A27_00770 [Candidatus Wildermuthbacteria bacterium RIFCSPLOWO2_01_FULL_47_18]|uniref:Uncharacterized protein n=2 Tax=Candidatus Wildermuthiibacteriota TaxID=1817923 RepID=A0A1G2RJN5_9BACT|nr:MAG: hypothetical protein A3J68_00775 [Candidatus Wildermuthbacteria bacterium RIFCSPHIGHO2_02_FULL_48_16]OHA72997.1 MAG: hypothetical protein A3A27_00770 [Candidatus Wildermuthbacteria bacterium RIFCSPLOWO2_01_FULL_47_18]OHB18335.1 MAG: hypothetical protein A2749_02145 [Parcubacteria group bacterium RIFCSPHIGHO2_01_FULL_45_26]
MIVTRDDQEGTFTLFPVTQIDHGFIRTGTSLSRPGNTLYLDGRTPDGPGAQFRVRGVVIPLAGTDRDDDWQISEIVKVCRSARGGVIFVRHDVQEGKPYIVLTGAYCAKCNRKMIDPDSCRERLCVSCRAKVPVGQVLRQ